MAREIVRGDLARSDASRVKTAYARAANSAMRPAAAAAAGLFSEAAPVKTAIGEVVAVPTPATVVAASGIGAAAVPGTRVVAYDVVG